MYENIGSKLRVFAIVSCIIGIVGSVIYGIILFFTNFLIGLAVIVLGSLISYLSSWIAYTIGETSERLDVVEKKLDRIARMMSNNQASTSATNAPAPAPAPAPSPTPITTVMPKTDPKKPSTYIPRKKCPFCGEVVTTNICGMCGRENKLTFTTPAPSETPKKPTNTTKKRCPFCGEMVTTNVCGMCGHEDNLTF